MWMLIVFVAVTRGINVEVQVPMVSYEACQTAMLDSKVYLYSGALIRTERSCRLVEDKVEDNKG